MKRTYFQPSYLTVLAITALIAATPFVLADSPQAGFKGGTTGAGTGLSYVTVASEGTLTSERVLTGTAGRITLTDGGANTTITLNTGTNIPLINAGNSWSAAQIPSGFGTIDLGSITFPWRDIFLATAGSPNYTRIISNTLTAARTFTLPDANSNPVQPDTGAANNFLTGISSAGVITKAQPAFSNISGTATIAQGGTNNGALGVSALGIYAGDGSKVVQITGTASQQFRVNAGGTAIEAFTPSAASGGFTVFAKAGTFTANDAGSQNFYRNSATGTITLPAATGSGVVKKFLQTSGTGTFAFTGGDVVRHANGVSDTSLTQGSTVGTIELIDGASGVWDET